MEPSSLDHLVECGSESPDPPAPRSVLTKGRLALAFTSALALGACCAATASRAVGAAPHGSNSTGVELWHDWNWKWDGVWRDHSDHNLWHEEVVMYKVSKCSGPRGSIPECQSTQCTQDGKYVVVGCIDGYCHHGIPDRKCKGVPMAQKYWHGWPSNEWCADGRRDRKCPAVAFTGNKDNRWTWQEIIARNLEIQKTAEAGMAPKENSILGSVDKMRLIPKVGMGRKPEHPKYVEGRVMDAECYLCWTKFYHSEGEAINACNSKPDCKGYYQHKVAAAFHLLIPGKRAWYKHNPDKKICLVKGYKAVVGSGGGAAFKPEEKISDVCVTPADCQTSGCNMHGFINHGCIKQRCYHGTADASCYGIANGKRYDGMMPGTWCWDNGRRDSRCPSK